MSFKIWLMIIHYAMQAKAKSIKNQFKFGVHNNIKINYVNEN